MHINLKNQISLVTGATGKIGGPIALQLAKSGSDIVIHYKSNTSKAKELKKLVESHGQRAICLPADLTEIEQVKTLKEKILNKLGIPRIIIANAVSQVYPWKPLVEEDPEKYENQFRSCLMQSVYLAQTFLPSIFDGKGGRFIAISTECVMQNFPGQSAYVSGKRALDGALRSLAREVGPKLITVNQVAPGWMKSEREIKKDINEFNLREKNYIEKVPMGKRGDAQEIANIVAFLASDKASFITGTWIPVCGGFVLPAI